MTKPRRAAVTALSVAAGSAGIAALLGDINIHELRGLATAGLYLVGIVAAFVFVVALFACLAEIMSK
jgi:hypothetical protein